MSDVSPDLERVARALYDAENRSRWSWDEICELAADLKKIVAIGTREHCLILACVVFFAIRSSKLAAYERAAKVAETWGKREAQITDTAFMPAADHGERFASVGIAERIRSLKDKT